MSKAITREIDGASFKRDGNGFYRAAYRGMALCVWKCGARWWFTAGATLDSPPYSSRDRAMGAAADWARHYGSHPCPAPTTGV